MINEGRNIVELLPKDTDTNRSNVKSLRIKARQREVR